MLSRVSECKMCGRSNVAPLYRSQKYRLQVGRCADCGLVFVLDDIPEAELGAMYNDSEIYHEFAGAIAHEKVYARRYWALMEIKAKLDALSSNDVSSRANKPKLFDVGAGMGEFLNLAHEAGFEVYGNELSETAARMAEKKYGLKLSLMSLEDYVLSTHDGFDVVTMWGLLEHVKRPNIVLEGAYRLLREGGLLLIYTPVWCQYDAIGLLSYRTSCQRSSRLLDRRINPFHLQLFSRSALHSGLNRASFVVVEEKTLCEYNLKLPAYLASLGFPSPIRRPASRLLSLFIDRGLFFHNNIQIISRRKSPV